jgi:hypothetical protein
MPSSERDSERRSSERRMRRLATAALVVLVPCTVVATGWRDAREIFHTRELRPVDVPAPRSVEYDGAAVRLVGLAVLPFEAGLPADRTFVRARLLVEPRRAGTAWNDCRLNVVDAAGRSWEAVEPVPDLLRRALAKPDEPKGASCDGLAVSAAKPGSALAIDGYYLVPRAVAPTLQVTLSTREGRPAYLRFSQGQRHD